MKLPPWVKKHKKAILITAGLPVAVPLLYIADVWLLGTLAAWLAGLGKWATGISIFATADQKEAAKHAFDSVSFYWQHPITTAWGWVSKSSTQLSQPAVRDIWLWLNLIVVAGSVVLVIRRIKGGGGKNSAKCVHGLEIVDNSAYGTSRWAGLKDLQKFCEFGPPDEVKVFVPTTKAGVTRRLYSVEKGD